MGGYLARLRLSVGQRAPDFLQVPPIAHAVTHLPFRLRVTFSGAYVYGAPTPAGVAATLAGWSWTAMLLLLLVRGLWSIARRQASGLHYASLASVASILALSLFISPRAFGYRYLLAAVPGMIALFVADLPGTAVQKRVLWPAALQLLLTGAAGSIEAPPRARFAALVEDAPTEDVALAELVADLEAAGIRHAYSLHPTLQWRLVFYSRDRMAARYVDPEDRLPHYPEAVDRAYREGRPVAIVGIARQWPKLKPVLASLGLPAEDVRVSGGRFFWMSRVPEPLLVRLGFRFEPGGRPATREEGR